jgi:hypothetical protein
MKHGNLATFGEIFPLDRLVEEREEILVVMDAVSFEPHVESCRVLKS